MEDVVDLKKARLEKMAQRGYRNWISQLGEDFQLETRASHISTEALGLLARGKDTSVFCLYDLIMNLQNLGSGFEFNELNPKKKMAVIDRYLFLLDCIRFEYMKRLGWLEGYPGEEFTLVELITRFEQLAPGLQSKAPTLSRDHPAYKRFCNMNGLEREEFIRKLIPKVLNKIQDHSTTL
jgi:hypothetical protein